MPNNAAPNAVQISAGELADKIRSGELAASSAIGRADAFHALTHGATGDRLDILGTSSKILAGNGYDVLSKVLYMMPAKSSGRQACSSASAGCIAACLAEGTGRMSMHASQAARRWRHAAFYADRNAFMGRIHAETARHQRSAKRQGKVCALRLCGTVDIPWHRIGYVLPDGTRIARIHDAFPAVRFYEYTKHPLAMMARGKGIPPNLHLTFSVSERPDAERYATDYLAAGYGAAVVMFTRKHEQPATFALNGTSYPVVDGDAHDARFLDNPGHVVALAAKGKAKSDTSGFVRAV